MRPLVPRPRSAPAGRQWPRVAHPQPGPGHHELAGAVVAVDVPHVVGGRCPGLARGRPVGGPEMRYTRSSTAPWTWAPVTASESHPPGRSTRPGTQACATCSAASFSPGLPRTSSWAVASGSCSNHGASSWPRTMARQDRGGRPDTIATRRNRPVWKHTVLYRSTPSTSDAGGTASASSAAGAAPAPGSATSRDSGAPTKTARAHSANCKPEPECRNVSTPSARTRTRARTRSRVSPSAATRTRLPSTTCRAPRIGCCVRVDAACAIASRAIAAGNTGWPSTR